MCALHVEYLNHAALRIDIAGVRLLSDPWFFGTAFSGGWGLRYDNPRALDMAAESTHLWISHWHSDHLHAPTLRALAELRPDIHVLANVSANFSMVERLRSLGYERVTPLPEREPIALEGGVEIERYPTAGIDNMLVIRGEGRTVLNYNDCNLPASALTRLVSRFGPVDLLLLNYNHAGKLYDDDHDEIRRARAVDVLSATVDHVGAPHVLPFASNHLYRVAASAGQNASLLSVEDLRAALAHDQRFLVVPVGGALTERAGGWEIRPADPPIPALSADTHEYPPSIPWSELEAQITDRCIQLGQRLLGLAPVIPKLVVELTDLGRTIELCVGHAPTPTDAQAHIYAHSVAVADWLGRRFGDDTFVAGAHFGLSQRNTSAIRWWALLTLLDASHLAPTHLLGHAANAEGRRFLWNRREEIWATLVGRRFKAGQVRL